MKEGIHPKYYDVEARCACGATWKTRSTKPELHLEICNNCHPFFTGRQKLIDTEGRVERFTKRFGAQTSESRKAGREGQPPDEEAGCRQDRPSDRASNDGVTGVHALRTATEQVAVVFSGELSLEPRDRLTRGCPAARILRARVARSEAELTHRHRHRRAAGAPARVRLVVPLAMLVMDRERLGRELRAATRRPACGRPRPGLQIRAARASTPRRPRSAGRGAAAGRAGRAPPPGRRHAPRNPSRRVVAVATRDRRSPARS